MFCGWAVATRLVNVAFVEESVKNETIFLVKNVNKCVRNNESVKSNKTTPQNYKRESWGKF